MESVHGLHPSHTHPVTSLKDIYRRFCWIYNVYANVWTFTVRTGSIIEGRSLIEDKQHYYLVQIVAGRVLLYNISIICVLLCKTVPNVLLATHLLLEALYLRCSQTEEKVWCKWGRRLFNILVNKYGLCKKGNLPQTQESFRHQFQSHKPLTCHDNDIFEL